MQCWNYDVSQDTLIIEKDALSTEHSGRLDLEYVHK